jgi:hypothetical protein
MLGMHAKLDTCCVFIGIVEIYCGLQIYFSNNNKYKTHNNILLVFKNNLYFFKTAKPIDQLLQIYLFYRSSYHI